MPLVDHYEDYETRLSYLIEAELFAECMNFPLKDQKIENPKIALGIIKALNRIPNVRYKVLRTIFFERKDAYISQEPPVEEEISIKRLEKIAAGEEYLPIKKYPVYASSSPRSVDIGD